MTNALDSRPLLAGLVARNGGPLSAPVLTLLTAPMYDGYHITAAAIHALTALAYERSGLWGQAAASWKQALGPLMAQVFGGVDSSATVQTPPPKGSARVVGGNELARMFTTWAQEDAAGGPIATTPAAVRRVRIRLTSPAAEWIAAGWVPAGGPEEVSGGDVRARRSVGRPSRRSSR